MSLLSPALAGRIFTTSTPGKPINLYLYFKIIPGKGHFPRVEGIPMIAEIKPSDSELQFFDQTVEVELPTSIYTLKALH